MTGTYEAWVRTSDHVFRAKLGSSGTVYVIEEGVPGYVDCISTLVGGMSVTSPEALLQVLTSWLYEMRRGYEVIQSSCSLAQASGRNI